MVLHRGSLPLRAWPTRNVNHYRGVRNVCISPAVLDVLPEKLNEMGTCRFREHVNEKGRGLMSSKLCDKTALLEDGGRAGNEKGAIGRETATRERTSWRC